MFGGWYSFVDFPPVKALDQSSFNPKVVENLMRAFHRWAVAGCVVACLFPRNLSFTSLLTAPPLTVAPLSQEDLQNGAYLEFRQSWFTQKRHNHLLWLPKKDLSISGPEDGGEVHFDNSLDSFKSMMVLGDSYADDVDMGFHCWPTRLSRALKLPLLNVARGGSESTHIHAQLERAHAYNRNQQLDLKPEEVLLILHTGGNDALNALLKPWMFTSLLSDLYSLRNSMNSGIPNPKKQELSFATTVSKNIVKELDTLLATAATLGHRKVLISTLPIVSSLPLARLLVHLLVPGSNATFVSEILQIIGGSMNEEIHRACVALAQKHGLQTWIFDEGSSLDRLAQGAQASDLGPITALNLALSRIKRVLSTLAGGSVTSFHDFWHDGHHPAAIAHQKLLADVVDLLKSEPEKRSEESVLSCLKIEWLACEFPWNLLMLFCCRSVLSPPLHDACGS